MTYDSYPNFAYDMYPQFKRKRTLKDRDWSRNLSRVRGISGISVLWNNSQEQTDGILVWNHLCQNRDR